MFLWVGGGAAAVMVCVVAYAMWGMTPANYRLPNGVDTRTLVAGRWDWTTRTHPCTDSAHVIAFSPDSNTMTITQEHAADSAGGSRPAIYDLQSIVPGRIRGAIRGETRVTDRGTPVVWELVLSGKDEYRWHRMDWSPLGLTAAVRRCR